MKNLRTLAATVAALTVLAACSSDASDDSSSGTADANNARADSTAVPTAGARRFSWHWREALVFGLLLGASACGQGESGSEDGPGSGAFALPGDDVFPNGVAYDPATGDFFTASTEDGTVYRADAGDRSGEADVFLEPGTDDRGPIFGMRVDSRSRLFLAGGEASTAFVYDTRTGALLKALEAEDGGSIGDVAVTDDAAFFTSSEPTLFRSVTGGNGIGELEPWVDLEDTPVPFAEGSNLDGIASSADGRYLVAVQRTAGDLWRIDTATGEFVPIDVGGQDLDGANGLVLDGTTLYAADTDAGEIVPVRLSDDFTSGTVGDGFSDSSLDNPTSIALVDQRLLVANHQVFGEPVDLPFTVSSLDIPEDD